jgi:hypothetical protein
MWIAFWTLLGIVIVTSGLCSAHAFDKLVTIERTQFPEVWAQDGKPCPGYFQAGLEWKRSFRASLASQRCSWKWAAKPPAWIAGSVLASQYQRRLRASGRVTLAAAIIVAGSLVARFTGQ